MTAELKATVDARQAAAQRTYAASKPTNLTPARTHVNSVSAGLYTGHGMTPTRAGADDHKQFKSLGHRAQVKVRTV